MNAWAEHRRFVIVMGLGIVALAIVASAVGYFLYTPPSCSDTRQNQGEAGVDCGGPCSYLCTAQQVPPTVLFTQLLHTKSGRTDLVASVENTNAASAARAVPYRITVYGADRSVVKELRGTIDLPPRSTTPIFMSGIVPTGQTAARAFLEIASSSPRWFTLKNDPRIVPDVSHTVIGGTTDAPRVTATLTNPTVSILTNVSVIVFVRGTSGNVIAASATVVPRVPAQGDAEAIFTWNESFPSTPLSVEVRPVIPLP